jgi:hypothetical protein
MGISTRVALVAVFAALLVASCGTTRSGTYWGETATLTPGGDRALGALRDAAYDPWTWAPLAGAAVLTIDDLDEQLSDWARDHTPVFGSTDDALDASHDLRALSYDLWILSVIATPSGDRADQWAINKVQGYVLEWAGTLAAGGVTDLLKDAVDRERPDGSNQRSFPSGHATSAAAYSSLAWRNVEQMEMPVALRWTIGGVLFASAAGTAWSRVEAGDHFPTDVLVGGAIGNFFARFVHDCFLGPVQPVTTLAYGDPQTGDWSIGFGLSW